MPAVTRNQLVLELIHATVTYGAESQAAEMWRIAVELWDQNYK